MFRHGGWLIVLGMVFATQVFAQEEVIVVSNEMVVGEILDTDVSTMVTSEPEAVVVEESTLSSNGNVSLDFRDADIRNVLQILAYKSSVNIVAGPEVVGTISIQLNDVPWKQALDVILDTNGYAYEQQGNVIVVSTVENMKKRREDKIILTEQEPLETRTYTINFGKASEIISSVEKMKTERGSVDFDERTNTIIVSDIPSKLDKIGIVIETLDTTTPQVLIEAKIVETTLTNTENLGIDWTVEASATGSAIPTIYPFTTAIDNKYTPNVFPAAEEEDFTFGTLSFNQFQAVLELLNSRSDTNILSNPRIVTVDNKAAQIVVGSQYPIPTYTYNEDQAKLQVSGWEYMDIGIIFNVTPHVNSAGFVTLDVEPKITEILDFVTVESTSLPRLSNESSKTSVMVKGGETLVIGGLIKDKTTDTKKKTPFFGDIPLVGLAFQKTEKTVTKQDLVIFITPHIITPEIASK